MLSCQSDDDPADHIGSLARFHEFIRSIAEMDSEQAEDEAELGQNISPRPFSVGWALSVEFFPSVDASP